MSEVEYDVLRSKQGVAATRQHLRRLIVEACVYHSGRGSVSLVNRLLDSALARQADPKEINALCLDRSKPEVSKEALAVMFSDIDYILENYKNGVEIAYEAVKALRLWDTV